MTQETGGFAALELHPSIVAAVLATGYEEPSAIQQQSIPIILAGHDMIGQAQTGTGKPLPSLCQSCTASTRASASRKP